VARKKGRKLPTDKRPLRYLARLLVQARGKVGPHTLRHIAATWLMQIGVGTWETAGFLGMSEKTVRDVYGHHHPDYLQGAANAIGTRKPVSLVRSQRRKLQPSQPIEIIGGPGSITTTLQFQLLTLSNFSNSAHGR
jgi:hypothetical protein